MKRDENFLLQHGFEEIDPKCIGCERVEEDGYCKVYAKPITRWRLGNCNMATHLKKEEKTKTFVDPLKASKKSMKGRR